MGILCLSTVVAFCACDKKEQKNQEETTDETQMVPNVPTGVPIITDSSKFQTVTESHISTDSTARTNDSDGVAYQNGLYTVIDNALKLV